MGKTIRYDANEDRDYREFLSNKKHIKNILRQREREDEEKDCDQDRTDD